MYRGPWLGQVRLVPGPFQVRRPPARRRLSGSAQTLTDATFNQALSAPKAVIDFWSPTCPPCMAFKPVFEAVAAQSGDDLLMFTMNGDEALQTMASLSIQAMPTTVYFADGTEVNRTEGKRTRDELLADIAKAFPDSSQAAAAAPAAAPTPPDQVAAPAQAPTTPSTASPTLVQAPPPAAPSTPAAPKPQAPPKASPAPAAASAGPSPLLLGLGGVAAVGLVVFLVSKH